MANENIPQIWGQKNIDFLKIDNKAFTNILVIMLEKHYPHKTKPSIASDLNVKEKRVDNWLYQGTGMTALDFMKLIKHYDFIKDWVLKQLL